VTLTVTLAGPNGESPTINPATGSPFVGTMGPVIPFAPGVFTIRFTNVPPPDLTTVRSSAGGIATSGVNPHSLVTTGAAGRKSPAACFKSFSNRSSL